MAIDDKQDSDEVLAFRVHMPEGVDPDQVVNSVAKALAGSGYVFRIDPNGNIEAQIDDIGDQLAAAGVKCEGGKPVNVCGGDPACPVRWCMSVD